MQRILAAMHQVPWIFKEADNEILFEMKRSHSSQISGAESLKSHYDVIWFGWCQESHDERVAEAFWKEKRVVLVETDPADAIGHYEGYCKQSSRMLTLALWPVFHYILWDKSTNGTKETRNWEHYYQVNKRFAEEIIRVYQQGDIIWIQDYHLMLVPSMLREALPKAKIGFFLHTPFPSSEIFRCLPSIDVTDTGRKDILAGVLGSTLIGFQTYSYARHFISTCMRVLGLESQNISVLYNGVNVSIGIFPIGISMQNVVSMLEKPEVQEKMWTIRQLFSDKRIIVSRDNMDPIHGIKQKLQAFEKFLEVYPEWNNNVVLVQISIPSNNGQMVENVSNIVSKINGKFGSLESVPVHHYHSVLEPEDYYALLSIADVALITPLRDGMNTTCYDYVICQKDNHGVLLLSEFAGTAGSMAGAVLVNPWDELGLANAINDALRKTTEERVLRYTQLHDFVSNNTADLWAHRFIKDLLGQDDLTVNANATPPLDFEHINCVYQNSQSRILFLDYDGTLTPIVKVPENAIPSEKMLTALRKLAEDESNVVFIISGRDQEFLDRWFKDMPHLGLSAEHGSFIKYPHGKWINLASEIDLGWKEEVTKIFEYYTERTQGSFIEHKKYAITWHYRLADPDYGTFQANECRLHLEQSFLGKVPIEVMVGKKNLEVRPISMNKGEIVKKILQKTTNCDFVFCAGDDRTDEDMFQVLAQSSIDRDSIFTCTIGDDLKRTKAMAHVNSPLDIIELLHTFAFKTLDCGHPHRKRNPFARFLRLHGVKSFSYPNHPTTNGI